MATKSDFIVKSGLKVTTVDDVIAALSADATVSGNVTATAFSGNGVNITSVNADKVGSNTASDLRSYSDTIAGTAYSNATSYADTAAATAYSNVVAYAASNTYVNSTFAPKANPTFTGTVSGTDLTLSGGITANGSLGNTGQVLTSNGSTVYWSSVSGGDFPSDWGYITDVVTASYDYGTV